MKIALCGNIYQCSKSEHIVALFNALRKYDAQLMVEQNYYAFLRSRAIDILSAVPFATIDDNIDVVISVGGDGTFLRTAEQVAGKNIPILGINAGRLGFLADVSKDDIIQAIDEFFLGNYRVEERTMLEIEVDSLPSDYTPYALNEVALLKQDSSSMITINTEVGENFLNSYQADGLIIATPTGSTGYSLSVGGPILMPECSDFVIAPVAPHTLNVRPLVIPDSEVITLSVDSRTDKFLISLDGRSLVVSSNKTITIRKAPYKTLVVKRNSHTFVTTLRNKLMWGADSRNS
jgi:NAD+ kinase